MTAGLITDPRILAGMKAQLSARAERLAAGSQRLGWKAGFGAPAAMQKFGLPGPLVGFMLGEALVASGQTVSLAGWTKPVAEPEIAVWLGSDLADGHDRAKVAAAIASVGPAIELADLNPPPEEVTEILSGNIFHRHVILGAPDASRAGARLDGLVGRITRSGTAMSPVSGDALAANTGQVLDVVAHIATTLASCGERLQRGEVIICGSVVPPLFLEPADTGVRFELADTGSVAVNVTWT